MIKLFFLISTLLFFGSIQNQDIPKEELIDGIKTPFSMMLSIQNFHIKLSPNQAAYTLALNFFRQDVNQNPEFSVSVAIDSGDWSEICQNPLAKNRSCFFYIPEIIRNGSNQVLNIQIKCLSSKCENLQVAPIIRSRQILQYERIPSIFFLGPKENQCSIFGFVVNKTSNFSKIILSIRVQSLDFHKIFQNCQGFTCLMMSGGNPQVFYVADQLVMVFKQQDEDLCDTCIISFVISSQLELIVDVSVRSYSELKEITLDREYYDLLEGPGLTNTYKLSLDSVQQLIHNQNKLFFMLRTFTGSSKSMYVHPDFQPKSTKDFLFNSTLLDYYEEEDIVIEREDLQISGLKGDNFYILINGDHEGLYKFEVKLSDNLLVVLSLGMSETRAIQSGEYHYYQLNLWNSALDDGSLFLKATVQSGNIQIFGRLCSFDTSKPCPLIQESDIATKTNISFQGDDNQGNKMIKFPSTCESEELVCYMQILVKGYNSTFLGLNRYTLLVTRENAIIILHENLRHDSHIELNSKIMYKLAINDPSNMITIIKFRINAELPYYVTRNNTCFEAECAEKIGTSRNPVNFSQVPFSGDYYIFVNGVKSSDFSFFPEVVRKDAALLEIPLSEGKSFKGILNENTKQMVFTFVIENHEECDVEVILQGPKDKFSILVTNGNFFGWTSTNNLLEFKHVATNNKLYRAVVRPLDEHFTDSSLEFNILFATDKTLRSIEKNKIAYETINALGLKYYVFYVDLDEDTCVVTKHIINPLNIALNLELYLSSSPYPEKNFYIYKAESAETSRIVLNKQEIEKLCINSSNSHHCPIYLSVYNSNGKEEIIYSLLVHSQNKAIEILEGHEQRFILNQNSEILRGFFIPCSKNSSLDFSFYTENIKFEVFLSIFDDKDNLALSSHYFGDFPNKTSHLFYLHENIQTSLVMRPKSFDFCWPHCIILFTISYNHPYDELTSLTVLITSNIIELIEGKSNSFSLVKEEFKYFYFGLEKFLKNPDILPNSTLILSLTAFYGYSNLYISILDSMKNKKPTDMEADYYIYSEHFTITKAEILSSLGEHSSDPSKMFSSARLVIGAFSEESDGKFMLNLVNSNSALQSIYAGIPQEVFLRNNTARYFQFYFGNYENFKVLFNRETGVGVVGILACSFDSLTENSELFKECVSKPETDFKIISGTGSSFFDVNAKNFQNYCQSCYFLIHVKSISGDLKGSLIVKEGEETLLSLQEGRKFYDHLNKGEESRFVFWTSGYDVVEVIVTVLQGNPIVYSSFAYYQKRKDFSNNFTNSDNSNFIHFLLPPQKSPNYDGPKLNEWDLPDEWGQYSHYYLIVYASKTTEYSINYVSSGVQVLQGGLIHLDALKPMDTKTYIYTHNEKEVAYMTLTFDQQNFTNLFEIRTRFRGFNELAGFKSTDVENITLEKNFEGTDSLGILIPADKKGTYFFEVKSKNKELNDKPSKFSLAVNSREISVVPLNSTMHTFISQNSMRFYEAFIPLNGFLVLELLQCSGSLEVLLTKNYDSVLLEDFEEDFKPVAGQSFINVMKIESGMVYFAMKSQHEASILKFSLTFYENYHQIPHVKYSIGNQGLLDYSFKRHEDNYKISFGSVVCEACDEEESKNAMIIYNVLHSSSLLALSAKGKCGVYTFNGNDSISETVIYNEIGRFPLLKKSLDVEVKLDTNVMNFVTLKAMVMVDDSLILDIYYPIIEIPPLNFHHRWIFWLVMWSIFTLLLICCLVSVHFFRKYRQAMKKLRYEMEDVRNIAQVTAVNTSIEMENKRYQGLAETN